MLFEKKTVLKLAYFYSFSVTLNENGSKTLLYRPMLNAFEKGRQKLSLLNLSKKDNIISSTFFKTLLQQSLKISLLLSADLLKAEFPIS